MSEKKNGLSKKVVADFLAGGVAGFCVTPVISAVDRALAENASGKCKLWPSFFNTFREMGAAPLTFLKSPAFCWIWLVYGGTYVGVNVTTSVCEHTNTPVATPKWMASFLVNTSTCIAKDRAFAKLFGATAPDPTKSMKMSYCAWLSRDLISMGVFFTLPPIVGKQIAGITGSEQNGYYAAQIVLPLLVQTITTPMHLLGYDFYNNPNNTFGQRITFLQKDYFQNVGIRMVRMAPPWSIGTILNKELRDYF